jgi:hypothetical protein
MEKTIRCKKCNTEFTTKIISWTKELHLCTNDINDVRDWYETRNYSRPQFTKCVLCRNMQSLMNFVNEMI